MRRGRRRQDKEIGGHTEAMAENPFDDIEFATPALPAMSAKVR